MALSERLSAPGPKRILALDGGGIRGAITLGFLAELERMLRERHRRPELLLCDYFDLIGGTSTGAIIAAGLATGRSVAEIAELYLTLGGRVFGKTKWKQWEARFDEQPLAEELMKNFGDLTLGDASIRTGLCIVAKRADTASTWLLINHARGKYYADNRGILLRHAVQASCAAPTYFVPIAFDVGHGQLGAFVDGGVSMANNPALHLFLVATLKGFPFRWATGSDKLLLVSVGTGRWRRRSTVEEVTDFALWDWATEVPTMLMNDAGELCEIVLQYISDCRTRAEINSEIGSMAGDLLGGCAQLAYLRYNVRLEPNPLQELGFTFSPEAIASLRDMSAAANRERLAEIGRRAAKIAVQPEHVPAVFDLPA